MRFYKLLFPHQVPELGPGHGGHHLEELDLATVYSQPGLPGQDTEMLRQRKKSGTWP